MIVFVCEALRRHDRGQEQMNYSGRSGRLTGGGGRPSKMCRLCSSPTHSRGGARAAQWASELRSAAAVPITNFRMFSEKGIVAISCGLSIRYPARTVSAPCMQAPRRMPPCLCVAVQPPGCASEQSPQDNQVLHDLHVAARRAAFSRRAFPSAVAGGCGRIELKSQQDTTTSL